MFLLDKWYLDCVADSGEAVIGYWATVRWGLLDLRYGAVLHRNGVAAGVERYTLRPGDAPRESQDGVVEWTCRSFDAKGTWVREADAIQRTLIDTVRGRIHWDCVSPRAGVEIQLGGRTLRGTGYVEHLTMTVKPWHLPFEQLRWGRFHSDSDVVVWIQWCGGTECSWVFVNGDEYCTAKTTPGGLVAEERGFALEFEPGATLRSGRLVNTALRSLRGVAALMPGLRVAHETKWLARARMNSSERASSGWVVHEQVDWE